MKTTTVLFLLFTTTQAWSQTTITLLPAAVNLHESNADLSDNYLFYSLSIKIKNETTDTLWMVWKREVPSDCPASWETLVSDIWHDYIPEISTNYDPSINLNAAFPILPADTADYFGVHLFPRSTAGCCEIAVSFSTLNDPDSTLATALFDYRINDVDCMVVATEEEMSEATRIFPNPTSEIFHVLSEKEIEAVRVFSLTGALLITEQYNNSAFDLGKLPSGSYFLQVKFRDGSRHWQTINKL